MHTADGINLKSEKQNNHLFDLPIALELVKSITLAAHTVHVLDNRAGTNLTALGTILENLK